MNRLRAYDGPELVDTVLAAVRNAGLDPNRLDLDDLAALDEFHALGRAATIALADHLALRPSSRALDVGAGIGGPARVLAALDVTPRFCRVNERLCKATGLAERVRVVSGDAHALPLADASFDAFLIQAALQNIADKAGVLAEASRVLAPGGRLAMLEVVEGPGGPLHFPVPWADGPTESILADPTELRHILAAAGLEIEAWNNGPAALAEIGPVAAELPPPPDNGLDLALLMPDHEPRMAGLARNVAEQRVELVLAIAVKPG